jgi:hypothetical protein
MISKKVDLNCKDSDYFEIEFTNDNRQGISTDQELFTRWMRDLRSGKYTQIHETLYEPKSETSYCALGVLCKKRIRRWRQKANTDNSRLNQEMIIDDILEHVSDYFTPIMIYSEQGYRYDIFNFLIELNDYCKLSFNSIADIMEVIHKEIRGEDNTKLLTTLSKNESWNLSAI